ncbi:MAG TPA: hypothetical protein EYP36_13455 [Calditrichaeota bacterium]|nr:hypothetical protein [Calditrichota bacterium]
MINNILAVLVHSSNKKTLDILSSILSGDDIKVTTVATNKDIKEAFENENFDIFICQNDPLEKETEQLVSTFLSHYHSMLTCKIGDEENLGDFNCDFFIRTKDLSDEHNLQVLLRNVITFAKKQRIQSELAALLLHDLRSPAQSIIGYLELLEKEIFGELNDGQHQILQNAVTLSDRLIYLLEELSQIYRFEQKDFALNISRIQLREFIDIALRTLWVQADKKNIKFVPQIAKDLPVISADGLALERVLINLLTNAIKFSPEKGTVRIYVDKSENYLGEPSIRFRIADSGEGIPTERLNAIFDKYYRLKADRRQTKGMGLGLYISKLIVEAHGGQIGVYNNREGGSTFYFTLPLSPYVKREPT